MKNGNVDITRMLTSLRLRWAGHVARMGDERRAHKFLPRRPRSRPNMRCEDNIIWGLKKIDYEGDWKTPRVG